MRYTSISIKVVHEQSGKVEYERERLLGIPKKIMNFHSDSQQPVRARIGLFRSLCSGTTLIEIAVYTNLFQTDSFIKLLNKKIIKTYL